MGTRWRAAAIAAAVVAVLTGIAADLSRPDRGSDAARVPVLVELYTSEGCSSCPPADALLRDLLRSQPVPGVQIVALGQHVDYWNRLGWDDPFSSPRCTARQHVYADFFRNETIYTPQMIVDGREEFVGGDRDRAIAAIERAARLPKGSLAIEVRPGESAAELHVTVRVADMPTIAGGADLLLAVTENGLETRVARGENAGRLLAHDSVVRELSVIGEVDGASAAPRTIRAALMPAEGWVRENLRLVAFVQGRGDRRVLGVAVARLTD